MVSPLVYYQLALLALLWLFVMLPLTGANPGRSAPPVPAQPKRKRSTEPKAFEGLTHKPHCARCERETAHPQAPPPVPPDPLPPTNRRPREVDTSRHFCPHLGCDYRGWLGKNNLRANGRPTICQAEFVTFFAPSIRPAYNEFGWHHSPYDDAAWPSGYAGVGRQYCVRPGHAAAPSPATPHTRC